MRYLLFFLAFSSLSALSISRDGAPYDHQGTSWQSMRFAGKDLDFTAALPGDPRSGTANGTLYSASKLNDTWYEVHTDFPSYYRCPPNEKLFLKELKQVYRKTGKVTAIKSNQDSVKYIAEVRFTNESKVARLYATNQKLYVAIIQGRDLKHASYFFNHIKIGE